MVRQAHLIALVVAFLSGCAVLLVAGASGVQAQASNKEEGRCEGTRTYDHQTLDPTIVLVFTTNDLPGCPKGGLLSGTVKRDLLKGKDGEDKVRGLGSPDNLYGGAGNDNLYGGPDGDYELIGGQGDDVLHGGDGGDSFEAVDRSALAEGDDVLYGDDGGDTLWGRDEGKDVLYGGDGNDLLLAERGGGQDKLYCGKGKDQYVADKNDHVDSSCEMGDVLDVTSPAQSDFAINDKGVITEGGDVVLGKCSELVQHRDEVPDLADAVRACEKAGYSASAHPVSVPLTGGPAFLLPAAALLVGSGIVIYAILRRR